MEGAVDNIQLLFAGEFDEVDGIARDADGKLWVEFGVLHGIKQYILVNDIDVDVVSALIKVAVQQSHEVVDFVLVVAA